MKFQGEKASDAFHGKSENNAMKLVYSESADLFSQEIKKYFKPGNYNLVDLGGHRGEFLNDILLKLPEYTFDSTVVDINDGIDKDVNAKKLQIDIRNTPFTDKSIDITIVRYVLAWNSLLNQKEILKEIARITKGIAIIQHQGSMNEDPLRLQNALHTVFNGDIPKLKRDNCLFTESILVETRMNELGIEYEKIQNRMVKGLSDIFIERFSLSEHEAQKTKDILHDCDYIIQTTWVLKFK
jgi:hypothetical protein